MKDQVLERLLGRIMRWEAAEVASSGSDLQTMATVKYDEYEGFAPGEQFLESLAAWLWQFELPERAVAVEMVLRDLVFISRAELDHAIETVYPDIIRPLLVRRVAHDLGIPPFRIAEIVASERFQELHRKVLILGLADGARLDRLRRLTDFSTEQFFLAPEISEVSIERMHKKLREALKTPPDAEQPLFEHVLLVDDFAGSGFTMLREAEESDQWEGRLWRTAENLRVLAGDTVVPDPQVTIILYVASARALSHLTTALAKSGLSWDLRVVQVIGDDVRVNNADLLAMCDRYFDPAIATVLGSHIAKGGDTGVHGFRDGRLPLVLSHNTPNNSISLLWASTVGLEPSEQRRALFPRRHRHNAERP